MTEYTPSTNWIRNCYLRVKEIQSGRIDLDGVRAAEFDRWLAAHDAEQRSRIAALEAVTRAVDDWFNDLGDTPCPDGERLARILDQAPAPSAVLDQMIREAKAEALTEAAARARALFDMATTLGKPSDEWLADRAAEYRNGDA